MDVCKRKKAYVRRSTAETRRQPLVPADNKNQNANRMLTREISRGYGSATPSATNGPNRDSSPTSSRRLSTLDALLQKGAVSAERKPPSESSLSPSRSPSTPVQDITAETLLLESREAVSNELPESLRPSTMRNLNVTFRSDGFSAIMGKKRNILSYTGSDGPIMPPSDAIHTIEVPSSRMATPERKKSPLRGKNSAKQLEKSFKILGSSHTHLVDQHPWPARACGRTFMALNENTDKMYQSSLSKSRSCNSLRKSTLDGVSMIISRGDSGNEIETLHNDLPGMHGSCSSSSSDITSLSDAADTRTSFSSIPRLRHTSSSMARGVCPSQWIVVNPSSRGNIPATDRPSCSSSKCHTSTRVLSYVTDIMKQKKTVNNIEDIHHLRLLYNKHLQWRYANARINAALHSQKMKGEKMLYRMWRIIIDLRDSVRDKRCELQQLRFKLKLYSVLKNQMAQLSMWASLEGDHSNSLTSAIQDLPATTVLIPVTGGAKGNVNSIKSTVGAAIDVMQAAQSSLCSVFAHVEAISCLVAELSDVVVREKALLDKCVSLLDFLASLQVEDFSLRTHLLQMKQVCKNDSTH